jgi:hypothetical protein
VVKAARRLEGGSWLQRGVGWLQSVRCGLLAVDDLDAGDRSSLPPTFLADPGSPRAASSTRAGPTADPRRADFGDKRLLQGFQ